MNLKRGTLLIAVLSAALMLSPLFAQKTAKEDPLLQILQTEVTKNKAAFEKRGDPVYLLTYRVEEEDRYSLSATFGNLDYDDHVKRRILTIQIRVGDNQLDNFRELRDNYSFSSRRTVLLSNNESPQAIAQTIWNETEEAYRDAMLRYEKVKANVAVKVETDDKALDYSENQIEKYYEAPLKISFNTKEWIERIKTYSNIFSKSKEILDASASIRYTVVRKYLVNSEGTSIVENNSYAHLFVNVNGQAEDGMELPLWDSYFAHNPQELPSDREILPKAEDLKIKMQMLLKAPVVDTYTGPALLSNDAAGVFFHEIFGHRVEGVRMKSESDGQTFKKKVNELVLHPDISVIFDPTIRYYQGIPLNGSYTYDDEGVRGTRVLVVDKGVMKNFLMTRTPIDNFPKSNGHARAQAGYQPVSRQSNLIVETQNPYTDAQLRTMLIDEAKAQGKEYGYYFVKVQGGFTTTGRYLPNSFNVTPIEVYRIYVDGRPDQLVRGVDLVGTPLAMFSKVEAIGDTPGNFAGTCGAESGGVPAGCCSPALFVKQIEVQKKEKSQNRPPVLDRPYTEDEKNNDFSDIAFRAMQDEMDNNMKNLKIKGLKKPYAIDYMISDAYRYNVVSTLGGIVYANQYPVRDKDVNVFVGTNRLNDKNFITENSLWKWNGGGAVIPIENTYNGIRHSLWKATDEKYKEAAEIIEAKNGAITQQNLPKELLELPDKTEISPKIHIEHTQLEKAKLEDLELLAKKLSAVFLDYPNLSKSGVNISGYQANVLYLSSEGVKYQQPFSLIYVHAYAQTLSDDGELLKDNLVFYTKDWKDLPSEDEMKAKIKTFSAQLEQLRNAPVIEEAYSGPVMFTEEAVLDIVKNAFIEDENGLLAGREPIYSSPKIKEWYGNQIPKENALEGLMGKKVISRDLSVRALDGLQSFDNTPLIGSYKMDAEGVEVPSEVSLIKDGVLQNLLSDRIPTLKTHNSNGHRRFSLSYNGLSTSLCSGVIELSSKNAVSCDELKKKLISMAKEEDYEYAYIVTKLALQSNDAKVQYPIYAYRVSVKDGSETLVRMSKVSRINLKSFKRIAGVSDEKNVFNTLLEGRKQFVGYAMNEVKTTGAPASFILPQAILFQELDIEKNKDIQLKKEPFAPNPLSVK